MNPDHIQDIITMLKDDKSCVQPWRNKAIARLEEAIAFVEKGHNTSNLKPPAGMQTSAADPLGRIAKPCTCPHYPEATDATCPRHSK